jgi:hypothetical protein
MLRISGLAVLALSFMTLPASAVAQTPFERQVLDALNQARTNPIAYAETLKRYRTYFHAKVVSLPNSYDALIIGGGHNGLVCAFYLARAG